MRLLDRRWFYLLFFILCLSNSFAYDAEVDGIYVTSIGNSANMEKSTIEKSTVNAGVEYTWNSVGIGTYVDKWTTSSNANSDGVVANVEILKAEGYDRYRILKPYEEYLSSAQGAADWNNWISLGSAVQTLELWIEDGIVFYDAFPLGLNYQGDSTQPIYAYHPSAFIRLNSPDFWQHNKFISDNIIQLAPYYYIDGVGGWNKTQNDGIILITIPETSTSKILEPSKAEIIDVNGVSAKTYSAAATEVLQVPSFKSLNLTFPYNISPLNLAAITMKDAKDNVVEIVPTCSGRVLSIATKTPIIEDGDFTITVPARSVKGTVDGQEVQNKALPVYQFKVRKIRDIFLLTAVDPVEGEVKSLPQTVKLTFSKDVRLVSDDAKRVKMYKDGKAMYNVNMSVDKANKNVVSLTNEHGPLDNSLENLGEWTVVIPDSLIHTNFPPYQDGTLDPDDYWNPIDTLTWNIINTGNSNYNLNITSLYFDSSKFDPEYSNTVTVATTWNQFSKVVLQDALNMTSSTFDYYYMADCMGGGGPVNSNDAPYVTKYAYPITQNGKQGYQLKVFNFGKDIYGNTGTPPSVGTANEETSNTFENKELGTAIYYPHGEGTGKHIFSWTLSHEELTYLLGSSSSITITRWIRFAAKNSNLAPYPYIWIKLTMEVTKYTPTFTEGFEFYGWPIVSGETPLEDTVLNNIFVYIRKGQVYQDMCINPSKTITLIDGWNDEIKYREGKLEYYPDFALPEEYGGADPNLKAYIIRWNPAIEPHEFDGKPFLARVVFPEASFGNEVYGQWLNGEDVKESDCIVNGRIGMTFNIDNNRATQTTTYSLNITSSGNGSANYNGTTIRNRTNSFTVDEGANATISFNPDNGYRIKSVWVNNSNVTNSVYSNQYIISDIRANTTLSVEFEAIPASTYSLSITASGNGSATYNGTSIRNRTTSFTVDEGTSATITFTPDNGYRIKSVKENNTDVTSYVSNGGYTINSISKNTTIEVEFEAIPVPTYSLSITATGNGSVTYNGTAVRNQTHSFTVDEGTSATITFTPDNGNSIASVKLNNSDITSQVSSNSYTINNITANTTLSVTFQEDVNALTVDGLNYTVTSQSNRTVTLTSGGSGQVLTVPATITQNGLTWKVTGIDKDALKGNTELAAIIWNPEATFTATVSNPNLLLYVKSSDYAPSAIQNVVVNGTASNIVLAEAKSGNNFYCPQSFVAQKISYTHNYQMQTGIGEARGWETIALPFDVQTFTHDTKGEIKPFAQWKSGDAAKPFWLMELTGTGFVETESIKAYTPYIISMPNNPQYDSQWLLNGKVTFVANSVTIGKTEDLVQPTFNGRTFIPCFAEKESTSGLYALNVNNDFETNNSGMTEGSWFVLNKRNVHPFEAYMTSFSSAPQHAFGVFEDMTTGIQMMINGSWTKEEVVYDLQGRKVNAPSKKGVYIVNGKKKIIK